MVLVIDFDNNHERSLLYAKSQISDEFLSQVFIAGVLSEPENLKGSSRESIGKEMAEKYCKKSVGIWGHKLLKHNQG